MSQRLRTVLATLGTLAGIGLVAAVAVIFLGVFNTSARWTEPRIVAEAIHQVFESSVRRRAPPPSEVPDLDQPGLVELGARHFDAACRGCHAVPGEERTATIRAMEPPPPHITEAVAGWTPAELHQIVWAGVHFSGMPAWPSAREDGIWPVVAYLSAVQQGLTPETQAGLTATPQVEGPEGAGYCAGCHDGRLPHVPHLSILPEAYLASALQQYRDGRRQSGIMAHAASAVPEDALPALATWLARQPAPQPAGDFALAQEGAALARAGTGDVPACTACHGPGTSAGAREGEDAEEFPPLAGQDRAYLQDQLLAWREGGRGGGALAPLMQAAARDLTDADIAALADYYAGLAPEAAR
ncbi:c-type cytochrome [Pseudoroseicyclus aestuarii]|uniref:Cytochrome c553 n=1 Tax=Pseudoroseicyclus aestuarii TaxID=1795041 RepID=A0A318SVC9_9RHOB|nr:c-type cytochrome [Pseudoroseicyclus aestuarii]PYE85563.1 cytochrome c553 [Pseudoroseicyclus aestuarii]